MAGVLVPPDQLRRLGDATLAVERMGVSPVGQASGSEPVSTPLLDRSPGLIRAILCEPLYGHSTAIANISVRRPFLQMIDVQVMGWVPDPTQYSFRLRSVWNGVTIDSDPIRTSATAAEFQAALAPWQFAAGDVFVSHGAVAPERVPLTLRARSAANLVVARWTVAFVGPSFTGNAPRLSPVEGGDNRAIAICHRSVWHATDRFEEVIEAGLIPDQLIASNYNATRFSIPAGSAILAGYCPGAPGWVVMAAETRKFQGLE